MDKGARGRGVHEALLAAAVEHAFARGAKAIEAYPHLEKRGDYMGHIELFRAHGFEPCARLEARRREADGSVRNRRTFPGMGV